MWQRGLPMNLRGKRVFWSDSFLHPSAALRFFYQTTVDVLHELFGLDAVKLFSYYPPNEELYLLAIRGVEQCHPRTILDANKCLCKVVIRDQQVEEFDLTDENSRRLFDDPGFLGGLRATKMVTTQFSIPQTHIICAIC